MTLKRILYLLSFLALNVSVTAQEFGSQVFNSLNIPGSARISALGGTYIPVQDGDLELGIYNPSVLDSSVHNMMSMGYVNYFSNIKMGYAAYAKHCDSLSTTFAASIKYMSYGKFDEIDASGLEIGSFYAGDMIATLGAGKEIDTNWRIGANVKLIYSALAKYNSFGVATDLSATYFNPERRFTAVWILKNAGVQLKTYTGEEREKLPFELQFGISKRLLHAPFRFSVMFENLQVWDLDYENANEQESVDPISGEVVGKKKFEFGDLLMRHVVVGGEILFTENMHIRFGYNYKRRQELQISTKPGMTGMSFGVGFKLKRFNLSYARSTYHISGASNQFSISTRVGT